MIGPLAGWLVPRRISGQIILLVVSSVVIFHIIMIAAFALISERRPRPELSPPAIADRFVEFVRLLDRLQPGARQEVLGLMQDTFPVINLALRPDYAVPVTSDPTRQNAFGLIGHLARTLGPELSLRISIVPLGASGRSNDILRVFVPLRDGTVVSGDLLPLTGPPGPPGGLALLFGTLAFIIMVLTTLLWWAARGLTRPLARFADAAERFSLDRDLSPITEAGPVEVKTTAQALNRMQQRIRALMTDRTRMLAAISHDLRTPITRLRLRVEFVEDQAIREPLQRDLDQMGAMVNSALSYLRDGQVPADRPRIDVASLLQTICSDFVDMGSDVSYAGPGHLNAHLRPDEIRRAITNLVDNGLRHGKPPVELHLCGDGTSLVISVVDKGAGIPVSKRDAMLEPFARGDMARDLSDQGAGFGLGLAIARTIAEAHGGTVTLHDRDEGAGRYGFAVCLRLPHLAGTPLRENASA